MTLLRLVKRYIEQENMIPAGSVVLAAVSGGVDSMVMADLLRQLQEELRFSLAIATFDHQLRPESAAEAYFVRDWAALHQLPFFAGTADIAALAVGRNLQDTARRERYAFLRHIARQLGDAIIAVAQHSDDQAETVLLHLLRGSGPAGLAGISPAEDGVIRPLLATTRAKIALYAGQQGIEHCEDASNRNTKYLRNRIRLELLPQLQTYNPQIVAELNDTAQICRDEDTLLDEMAELSFAELWREEESALSGFGFSQLLPALQRRVLRKAYCLLAGERSALSFAQVECARMLKEEQICSLPGSYLVFRRQGNLYFAAEKPALPTMSDPVALVADGSWQPLFDSWEYLAEPASAQTFQPDCFLLPAADLANSYFRTRRSGDSVLSAGKKGRKKIKEIFINAKIAPLERACWPLLLTGEALVWLPGLWQAERAVTGKTILIKIRRRDKIASRDIIS